MAQHEENRPIDDAVELLKTKHFAGLADADRLRRVIAVFDEPSCTSRAIGTVIVVAYYGWRTVDRAAAQNLDTHFFTGSLCGI